MGLSSRDADRIKKYVDGLASRRGDAGRAVVQTTIGPYTVDQSRKEVASRWSDSRIRGVDTILLSRNGEDFAVARRQIVAVYPCV